MDRGNNELRRERDEVRSILEATERYQCNAEGARQRARERRQMGSSKSQTLHRDIWQRLSCSEI